MSLFEVITKEEFESSGRERVATGEPSRTSTQGAKQSRSEDESAIIQTYPCTFCGHCETPDDCAWSRECPKCHAPAGKIGFTTYCKTPTGGITGLHTERWEGVTT